MWKTSNKGAEFIAFRMKNLASLNFQCTIEALLRLERGKYVRGNRYLNLSRLAYSVILCKMHLNSQTL